MRERSNDSASRRAWGVNEWRLSGHRTNSRRSSRGIFTSAPRRPARCGSARRRRASRPRSSSATRSSSRASSTTRCARQRSRRAARSASGSTASARRPPGGVIVRELAEESDRLENAILAERVEFRGESLPLRSAQAQLAVLDDYAARDELGELAADASARFNCDALRADAEGRGTRRRALRGADPVAPQRGAQEHRPPRPLRRAPSRGAPAGRVRGSRCARSGSTESSARERDAEPASYHVAYLRRMSPFADLYAKERCVPICLATLSSLGFDLAANDRIKLDLDDRPQKSPRACVIASDPPAVVHLITRAQGGLHDYQAFLHEAGHALHYAGLDPELPYTFRRLSRDHALTEIYSFLLESITREPGWHALALRHHGRRGRRARRGRTFPRGAPLPALRGQARLRARLLGRLRERERLRPDLRGQPPRCGRLPLPRGRLPRGHGRRLLLGRLPSRLDPHGAAPGVPAGDDRRGLVAPARDGRAAARRSSPKARGRRARRSPTGSATTRSTRLRSSRSSSPLSARPR